MQNINVGSVCKVGNASDGWLSKQLVQCEYMVLKMIIVQLDGLWCYSEHFMGLTIYDANSL